MTSKYMEALERLLSLSPRLLALWYYCKREADEHGVPDVTVGRFPRRWVELHRRLAELRSNLENHVRREDLEHVEKALRFKTPEELYTELLNQESRRPMG
ncbi:MAG: hypothetical protein QXY35_07775, partial [Thermofilaceae archaeon]